VENLNLSQREEAQKTTPTTPKLKKIIPQKPLKIE